MRLWLSAMPISERNRYWLSQKLWVEVVSRTKALVYRILRVVDLLLGRPLATYRPLDRIRWLNAAGVGR